MHKRQFPLPLVLITAVAALALPQTGVLARAPATGSVATPREDARADAWARATLARMSLEDKIALLHGRFLALVAPAQRPAGITVGAGYVAGNGGLGIPPQVATDASLGVSNLMDMRKGDVATVLPSGMAMAATWNPSLVREAGRMIGSQARAKGFNVMLAGGVNLVRDPRAGRNFEYLGEDPLLAGTLVAAQIEGIQSNAIIATIKHFALNNQETGRANASVELAETAMRESDLLAFQLGIEGGSPGAVMCAYNKIGGSYACENRFLLTDVLRRDWGYRGFVMSDWGAVHSTEALLAGLDQQQGEQLDKKRWLSTELLAGVKAGALPVAAVDTAARRVLRTMFVHGLVARALATGPIDYQRDGAVSLRTAEEAIVLLKNEGDMLPFPATVKRIVVVGGHADIGVPAGGGSSQVTPVGGFAKVETVKDGAAAGFARKVWGGTPPLDALRRAFPTADVRFFDGSDPDAAAAAASNADVAVVFAEKFSTEAMDQPDLSLDGRQDALIDAVASANPRTVVVLETGNAVAMPWLAKTPAVVAAWYSGQRGGDAIAGVLAGSVNPSGRLPVTFPASTQQLPNPQLPGSGLPPPSKEDRATYGVNTNSPPFTIRYPEGADVGYRWFDRTAAAPLFAFGHGLSYASFRYDGLRVSGGRTATVAFRVTNTGSRTGADVPQVYATLPGKPRRLIGWSKPVLAPGESKLVRITADRRLLGTFDSTAHRWRIAHGPVGIEVARSATAPVLTGSAIIAEGTIKP
ncbi:beta-glucosidase [Novosphingobium sp.]|uniref:beta-glucosidase family protein n=1 Tax=Novosphingobium sp. TaxID=1874826 RepID=UPI0038BAB9C3